MLAYTGSGCLNWALYPIGSERRRYGNHGCLVTVKTGYRRCLAPCSALKMVKSLAVVLSAPVVVAVGTAQTSFAGISGSPVPSGFSYIYS